MQSTSNNSSNIASGSSSTPAPLVKTSGHKNGERPVSMALSAGGTPAGKGATGAGAGGVGGAFTNYNRGAIAPARILGAALRIYGDHMKQVITGVEMSFSILTLPSELISAFNEVDSFISNAQFPVHAVSSTVISLANGTRVDNKTYDAVASSVLVNPLREPFHRDALQEVYELYNAMEFIMKKEAAAALQSAATAASAAGAGPSVGTFNTRVPFGPGGGAKNHVSASIYPPLLRIAHFFLELFCFLSPHCSSTSCRPAVPITMR